jgi:hypothetical protein
MEFKEWLDQNEAYNWQRYKKRRLGAVTGSAKAARRGGGIAAPVNPANLSKTPTTNPAGQTFKGIDIGGPDYKTISKIHNPTAKTPKYLPNPFQSK